MPSTITHTLGSLSILERLNNEPKDLITKHIEDYKTFSQGMDPMFFYRFYNQGNYVIKAGYKFHKSNTLKVFKDIIEFSKKNLDKTDMPFIFLSGLTVHYVMDSNIHPYVNYHGYTDDKLGRQNNHFFIETHLDNYMLDKYNKDYYKKYKTFKHYKLQFNVKKDNYIVEMLNNIFSKYYNLDNMGNIYYKSIKYMKFVFRFARLDKLGIKKEIYKLIDKNHLPIRRIRYMSYNFDYKKNIDKILNKDNKEWCNIKDKNIISTKSFDELLEYTIEEASNKINKLYEYIYLDYPVNIDKLIGNYSYSTGLELKD